MVSLAKKLISPGEGARTKPCHITWLTRAVEVSTPGLKKIASRERMRLSEAFAADDAVQSRCSVLSMLFAKISLKPPKWRTVPEEGNYPAVVVTPDNELALIYGRTVDGFWLVDSLAGRKRVREWPANSVFTSIDKAEEADVASTAISLFRRVFNEDRAWLYQMAFASLIGSVLALATSLYSMQVYDRVISTGGVPTLVVLCIGVGLSILIELAIKIARALIVTDAVHDIDVKFGRGIFERVLRIRMDQFPQNVGTLAAQVRGFETVRAFKVAATQFFVADAPFALFFLFVIFLLGGLALAIVPATALCIAILAGLAFKHAVQKHAQREIVAGNLRQGLLVDVIHGSETLRSAGGGWRVLGRWNDLSRQASQEAQELKRVTDLAGFLAGAIQQVSYVALVTVGAWLAISGSQLTIGAIIACSIISGRVLTPINMVPGLMMQWGHARVALDSLEKLFTLECDNHKVTAPLAPEALAGRFQVSNVEFSYPGQPQPQVVSSLSIDAGERVAVVGAIGAGKTTLLKMLAGLCKPQRGNVFLDGLDVFQLDPERRSEIIGYLPQRNRLFAGTLRDNLLLGRPGIPDTDILTVAEHSGLSKLIASHPEGLDFKIHEGGQGLSGGQAQLVAFTRLLLANPDLWLLDEPTASMDDVSELQCLKALKDATSSGKTLVIVTHKMRLLELVDRIVVLSPQGIVIDGPSNRVLAQLRQPLEKQERESPRDKGGSKAGQQTTNVAVTGGARATQ